MEKALENLVDGYTSMEWHTSSNQKCSKESHVLVFFQIPVGLVGKCTIYSSNK